MAGAVGIVTSPQRSGPCSERQLFSSFLDGDSHRPGTAGFYGLGYRLDPVEGAVGILYYRLIFRQQSVFFQELQEKFLLVDLNMLIRFRPNEALRILEPGHKSGLGQFIQTIAAVELSVRLTAAKEPVKGFLARPVLQIVFQIPRRTQAGDLPDREVIPVIGDDLLYTLIDSGTDLIHHRGDGLGHKRDRPVCEDICQALRQIQCLASDVVYTAERQTVFPGDTAVRLHSGLVQIVNRTLLNFEEHSNGILALEDCHRHLSTLQPALEIIASNGALDKVFHQVIPPIVMPVLP